MGGSQWGGSEALWHKTALYALEQGDEVLVSVYDWGKAHSKIEELQDKGAIICYRERYNNNGLFFSKIKLYFKNRIKHLNNNYKPIIVFKPTMVFISQGDTFDLAVHHKQFYTMLMVHHIKFSLVCHGHAQYSFIPDKLIYPGAVEIFDNAKKVFFVSYRQWELTKRRLISDINNGVFTWNPLNVKIPESPLIWPSFNTIQFAIVGGLDGTKGHDTVLEILSKTQWLERKWKLNIYGSGYGIQYLKDLSIKYKIQDKVFFHGYVNDINIVWANNHVLLIASAGEGLPISLVECMGCGRIAIVTDVGGNTELIEENLSGFIAASPTVNAFDLAMERALLKKDTWVQMGINAFEKINLLVEIEPQKKVYNILINE